MIGTYALKRAAARSRRLRLAIVHCGKRFLPTKRQGSHPRPQYCIERGAGAAVSSSRRRSASIRLKTESGFPNSMPNNS